ncbi:lipopolysaccharide kinase InaA family protein [Pseudomonas matsuisoli]|uniref:Lipopolysaccharide kinase (Kdo/WaaP) family protein n=1 Tax=Pseudomonas matsuisoli TaxID=1515666 RepID=A0A917Q350_9PSED|nr:lipopolysaccharide kinase InaA family protein [Pseudomonas matsuisoli]GGK09494.1 hypothetical protein GCM10009304_39480 [Pseudomonas matsuisoli]
MKDFIHPEDRVVLERHGLTRFDALWSIELTPVDEANTGRGGWSQVFRLDLGDTAYYLKRQSNYMTRTLARPWGETTFSREFRNIRRYERRQIPALKAAFYGERRVEGERRAILLTRALDGWRDLDSWLEQWGRLAQPLKAQLTQACGALAHRLHGTWERHGCFYPKHIFLRATANGFEACLIDLEKTRPLFFGRLDRIKDLEPLLRRTPVWSEEDMRDFLSAYLRVPTEGAKVSRWYESLGQRRQNKEARA